MNTSSPASLSSPDTTEELVTWLSPASSDTPDFDDPELNISCRSKTALAAMPNIISEVAKLLVINGQTLEVNFTLNPDHRFVPGDAPRTCSTSIDDITWLQARSENLFQVDFPFKAELAAQNRLRATLKFKQFGVRIVFAFRLKYREGPETPRLAKKVVLLATIMPMSRDVALAKG